VAKSCTDFSQHSSWRSADLGREHWLQNILFTKFESIFFIADYLPVQTDNCTKSALNKLYTAISKQENAHPEAAHLVVNDFNEGELKSVLPQFYISTSPVQLEATQLYISFTPKTETHTRLSLPSPWQI
jgi:hypothetical protein